MRTITPAIGTMVPGRILMRPGIEANHDYDLPTQASYVQMSLLELLLSKCLDFQRVSVALLRIQHRMRTLPLLLWLDISRTNAILLLMYINSLTYPAG